MPYNYSSNKKGVNTSHQLKAVPNSEEEINTIHETLKNPRCRYIMRTLYNKRALEKTELAEHVAAIENKKPISKLDEQEHKRVVVSLHQVHLPSLKKHKFVTWDEETDETALGSRSDFLLEHLYRIGQDNEDDE